jgi:hypothetical protein
VLGEHQRVLVGELAALVQPDGDPVLFDRALRGLAAAGELGDVDPNRAPMNRSDTLYANSR